MSDHDRNNQLQALQLKLEELLSHGCLTGDCPHEKQTDCDRALADEVRALVQEKQTPREKGSGE